ncbi:MAG: hypothetical protein PWQ57_2032 [Desulfovibrionales bacterium]|jgi:hypothetical protein|nr:hypothetical protein [Desulfovibrionales bacterium]
MTIYAYDAATGAYLSSKEARESPLEPGTFLIPANATTTAPPNVAAGQAAVWDADAGAWTTVEDHRGEKVYSTGTGAAVEVTALGALPGHVTASAPGEYQRWDAEANAWATDADALAAAVRSARDAKLSACDWTQLPDSPLDDDAKADWRTYRQALRDLPGQGGFPASSAWPKEPTDGRENGSTV